MNLLRLKRKSFIYINKSIKRLLGERPCAHSLKGDFTIIEKGDCLHFTKTLRAFIRDLACLMVVIGRERKRELVKNVINRKFFLEKGRG